MKKVKVKYMGSVPSDQTITTVGKEDLEPLQAPYDKVEDGKKWPIISDEKKEASACNLDGVVAINIPKPKNAAEEKSPGTTRSRAAKRSPGQTSNSPIPNLPIPNLPPAATNIRSV